MTFSLAPLGFEVSSLPQAARYAIALMLRAPAAPRRRSRLRVSSSRINWSKRRSNSVLILPPSSGHLGRVQWRRSALATLCVLDDVDVLVPPGQAHPCARS